MRTYSIITRASACALALGLASLIIALRSALMKLASSSVSPYQGVLVQTFVAALAVLPFALRKGPRLLITRRSGTHILRGLAEMGMLLIAYWLLQSLPTVHVTLMLIWGPIFIPILALIAFKREIARPTVWFQLIGWAGVLVVCFAAGRTFGLYLASGIGLGFLGGTALLASQELKDEPAATLFFYSHITACICLLPSLLWAWSPLSWHQVALLAVIGLVTALIEGLIRGSQAALPGGRALSPLIFTALIFSGIADWMFWSFIPGTALFIGLALATISAISVQLTRS